MASIRSIRSLLILLGALLIGLCRYQVSAGPLRSGISKRHFVPTAQECAAHINLPENTALFWSQTSGKHAMFARKHRLTTMDKAYGNWINPTNRDGPLGTTAPLDRKIEAPIWDALSLAMAVAAKGTVYVMLGSAAASKTSSTWNRVEFPALKANSAVTSIVELSPDATALADDRVIWPISHAPPGSPSAPSSPKSNPKTTPASPKISSPTPDSKVAPASPRPSSPKPASPKPASPKPDSKASPASPKSPSPKGTQGKKTQRRDYLQAIVRSQYYS